MSELRYTRLIQLTGVGPRLAEKIMYTLSEGIDPSDQERYALAVIEADPYKSMKVDGIGFKKADKIALNDYDVDPDSEPRHRYGNREALLNDGCLPLKSYQWKRHELGLKNKMLQFEGVTIDSGLIWLPEELKAEWTVAKFIAENLSNAQPSTAPNALFEPEFTDNLDIDQKRAVMQGLYGGRLMVLTGNAGSGKTTTLGALGRLALAEKRTMHVMAFSGKASERAADVLGNVAKCTTIHRGLGFGVTRPEDDIDPVQLDADIIVLDEASMIPTWLLAHVIKALPSYATLILTGDPAQLPPIGHGFPFADMIDAGVARVHLEQNYRQAGQVSIFELAEGVRTRTKRPTVNEDTPGLELHTSLSDDQLDHYSHGAVEFARGYDLHEWQVITHKNETREMLNLELQAMVNPHGETLFRYPCWSFGKQNGAYTFADIRKNDKVMIRKNDYDLEVFNGQTGTVLGHGDPEAARVELEAAKKALGDLEAEIAINLKSENHVTNLQEQYLERSKLNKRITRLQAIQNTGGIVVKIKDREVTIPEQLAEDLLCLGYCVTAHKGQGSGWPVVIIFQLDAVRSRSLPNRWWYTSVSRAEECLFIFTQMSMGEFWHNATEKEIPVVSTLQKRVQGLLNLIPA